MLFYISNDENRKAFLLSMERLVSATYPGFKFDKKFYKIPLSEINEEEMTHGLFSFADTDKMIELSREFVKTVDLKDPSEYDPDTVERTLSKIKKVVEVDSLYFPILYIKWYRELYTKIFS